MTGEERFEIMMELGPADLGLCPDCLEPTEDRDLFSCSSMVCASAKVCVRCCDDHEAECPEYKESQREVV
jgi:hypothetical protein